MRRTLCARYRPGHHESHEFIRAVFHHQARRLRHWSRAQSPNCGSARRLFDARESQWSTRCRSSLAFAEIIVPKAGHQNPENGVLAVLTNFECPSLMLLGERDVTLQNALARALQ